MGVLSWIWMLLILFSKIVVTVFWMAGESAGEAAWRNRLPHLGQTVN
jgi:hypothetical protein